MFFRALESAQAGYSWKALGSVAGVRCGLLLVTGRQGIYCSLCSEACDRLVGVKSRPHKL